MSMNVIRCRKEPWRKYMEGVLGIFCPDEKMGR